MKKNNTNDKKKNAAGWKKRLHLREFEYQLSNFKGLDHYIQRKKTNIEIFQEK